MRACFVRSLFWAGVAGLSALSVTPQEYLPPLGVWDKLQHVLAYAVLSALGGRAYPAMKHVAALFCGLVALGGALEAIQTIVPGREAGIADAVANAVGTGIGLFVERAARKFV